MYLFWVSELLNSNHLIFKHVFVFSIPLYNLSYNINIVHVTTNLS